MKCPECGETHIAVEVKTWCDYMDGEPFEFDDEDVERLRGSHPPRARAREAIKACSTPRRRSDLSPGPDRAPAQRLRHGHSSARRRAGGPGTSRAQAAIVDAAARGVEPRPPLTPR
jgi:hypothetical protein